ncbi:hypothetical protein HPB48_006683 [Haemaphysalis longicornis]|uniref:Uncharacterized protein n=1 Tax=Haemaphysalis longicornis TaxID=44386 RepID=A0A9J6GB20_HAELO|nr:hypothetical protein HPB48_006683 [Haemaphysalis longicornis]
MTLTLWVLGLLPKKRQSRQATATNSFAWTSSGIRREPLRQKFRRASLMLFVVFGYLAHFSAATVYNVTHEGGFFGFFANCGYVLRNVFACFTMVHFLVTQDELIAVLEESYPLRQLLPAAKVKQVWRFSAAVVVFTACSFVILGGATAYAGFANVQRYFDYYLYKGDVTSSSALYLKGLDTVMTNSLTLLLGCHVCVAWYLRALAADFAERLTGISPRTATAAQVKRFRWHLASLGELMRRFERIGSPVVLCWYLNAVGNLVLSAPGILLGLSSASTYDYLYMLTDLVANIASFSILTVALSEPALLVRDSHRHALWLAAWNVPGRKHWRMALNGHHSRSPGAAVSTLHEEWSLLSLLQCPLTLLSSTSLFKTPHD